MHRESVKPKLISSLFVAATVTQSAHGLLLSELPTPSLVLELRAIQRQLGSDTLRPLQLPQYKAKLTPILSGGKDLLIDATAKPVDLLSASYSPFAFVHSTVIRTRDAADPVLDHPSSTFLAQLDFNYSVSINTNREDGMPACISAKLVLGLNNHHVGSYYWARSAGAGASMHAPGILFDEHRGSLRWKSNNGPIDCNSNDGKRSEWVNFLRLNDTVQLVPDNTEAAMYHFGRTKRVYGVSSRGRPLGSEPEVLCTWELL